SLHDALPIYFLPARLSATSLMPTAAIATTCAGASTDAYLRPRRPGPDPVRERPRDGQVGAVRHRAAQARERGPERLRTGGTGLSQAQPHAGRAGMIQRQIGRAHV